VRTYLPEFTGGGKEKITLRHLLTHSAGIPSVPVGRADTEEAWQAAFQLLCAASTEWEPGSKTQYHGLTGMFMAAAVVRRLNESKPWERICKERLFTPLGAKSLTFELPTDAPLALTPQPKEPPKQLRDVFPYAGHPAGGCFGTPADALKVLQLHLNGGTWHGKRLLSEKALAEMHTVQYRKEIEQARAAGKTPVHEPWGLGPLLRGDGPPGGGHGWFGFRDQASPGVFGHAGIDTVIGVADPATGNALFFVTTDSPKTNPKTVELRNGVTNRVFAALGGAAGKDR
jgi:CubicO group peptidase (beta-lactamase class C family)